MMSRLSTSPTKAKDEYTNIPQSLHPEVVPDGGDLEVAPQDGPESYEKEWNDGKIQYVPDTQNANYPRRLCGLAPIVFWILILLMITLLAAGLGAGLGVGLSAKSSNSTARYGSHVLSDPVRD